MDRIRDRARKRNGTRRKKDDTTPAFAAIDLGTNNCRLLVAQPDGNAFTVIDSFSRIVRLGEGLTASHELGTYAIGRTIEALKICARKMQRNNVKFVRCVATEACRQASNSSLFFKQVKNATGLDLEVIPPEEEASLTLTGCLPLIHPDTAHALVFDIGGGSTEIMWIDIDETGRARLRDTMSLRLGVVSLAERFGHDKIAPDDYRTILAQVTRQLDDFDGRHGISRRIADGKVQMLGTSGTVTTLAGIHLDLPRYDRAQVDGLSIDFDNIRTIIDRLALMDFKTRCAHPCIRRERADLMIMGCAILDAICTRWPVGLLRVADRGIREGILMAMINDHNNAHAAAAQ
ncbi:MAG: Ppx/GppA phosphatase family protein [Rhodospirillales bacterium]